MQPSILSRSLFATTRNIIWSSQSAVVNLALRFENSLNFATETKNSARNRTADDGRMLVGGVFTSSAALRVHTARTTCNGRSTICPQNAAKAVHRFCFDSGKMHCRTNMSEISNLSF